MKPSAVTEELLLRFDILNADIANKLSSFINSIYWNNWTWIDYGIFIEECMNGIGNGVGAFDETKGSILPYLKQRIRYTLQLYIKKENIGSIYNVDTATLVDTGESDDVEIDLSVYTDREIEALFKVIHGKPNSEDKRIVKDLYE